MCQRQLKLPSLLHRSKVQELLATLMHSAKPVPADEEGMPGHYHSSHSGLCSGWPWTGVRILIHLVSLLHQAMAHLSRGRGSTTHVVVLQQRWVLCCLPAKVPIKC